MFLLECGGGTAFVLAEIQDEDNCLLLIAYPATCVEVLAELFSYTK